jgi:hypothetical protein
MNYKVMRLRVTYDVTPPVVEMEYPVADGAVNKSTISVAGRVGSDVDSVLINQVPVAVVNDRFSKNFKLAEGENTIKVHVTDRAGNINTRTFTLTLDTRPPLLELLEPTDMTYVTEETVTVSGHVEVGAALTLNGEAVESSGGYFTLVHTLTETPPGGNPNVLVLEATDGVGNTATVEVHLYRDTQAPRFSVYETTDSTINDFINITGAVDDPADIAEMIINDMPVQPNDRGYFEAYVPLDMGLNVFTITARDEAGNEYTQQMTVEREPRKVTDSGFMGLGDSAWLIMILCLFVGLFAGLTVLYLMERRKGVEA